MTRQINLDQILSPTGVKIAAITVGVILIGVSGYFGYQHYQKPQTGQYQAPVTQDEVTLTLEQLAKLTDLPAGETPIIYNISDKTKLASQSFFATAENGDRVILYQTAKKAYLYRPSTNKIIEITSISLNSDVTATTSAALSVNSQVVSTQIATPSATPAAQVQKLKVAIYNGTPTRGLAKTAAEKLSSQIPNLEIVKIDNAKNDYAKTELINLTNTQSPTLAQLTQTLGVEPLNQLPEGEIRPEAEVLVILGSDYQ